MTDICRNQIGADSVLQSLVYVSFLSAVLSRLLDNDAQTLV